MSLTISADLLLLVLCPVLLLFLPTFFRCSCSVLLPSGCIFPVFLRFLTFLLCFLPPFLSHIVHFLNFFSQLPYFFPSFGFCFFVYHCVLFLYILHKLLLTSILSLHHLFHSLHPFLLPCALLSFLSLLPFSYVLHPFLPCVFTILLSSTFPFFLPRLCPSSLFSLASW